MMAGVHGDPGFEARTAMKVAGTLAGPCRRLRKGMKSGGECGWNYIVAGSRPAGSINPPFGDLRGP